MLSTNIILLAIVMVGLIYLYYNKNLREGLSTEQRNKWNANAGPSTLPCPEDKGGPIITYNGKNYRTLHGLCPNSVWTRPPGGQPQLVCEGDQEGNTAGQWPGKGPLPAGWEIAPDNADSIHVIKSNQWSTPSLATNAALVKGGRGGAYLTGNAQWQDADNTRGKPGDEWVQGEGWPAIIQDHGNQIYGTRNCAMGILLSQNATPDANWSGWSDCQPSCGTQRTQTRTCLQSGDEGPCQPDADGMETTKSCSDNPCPTCKVPDFSTLNMVTAPTGGCTEGEVLQETKSCNVICNEASAGTSIMGTYKCSANGSMTGPNLTCTPKTCPLPSSFAKLGMTSASTNGCLPGGTLQEGDECGVICTAAYGKGSGTYKCSADGTLSGPGLTCVPNKCPALPSSFSDMGMMPAQSNPCSEGQILDENQQCNVTCMTDYSSGSTTTGTYACSANGSLSGPNLKCVENTCTLGTFGTGIEGANPSPCTSGGQLNAGQSCYLQCQTGYTQSGTNEYHCDDTGTLTIKPTLTCEPPKCTLDFDCAGKTHNIMPLPPIGCSLQGCGQNDCCKSNPYCSSIKCPKGRQFKPEHESIQCNQGTCQDETCCDPIPQPTCQGFSCPQHWSPKKNLESVVCAGSACLDTECCTQDPKPTCFGDQVECPPGYEDKDNLQDIQCENYSCMPGECCLVKPPPPPPPPPSSHKDISRKTNVDNRKWLNNSQRIDKHDWQDNRTQNLTQNNPLSFSTAADIRNAAKGSVFYPGSTFIVFDDDEEEKIIEGKEVKRTKGHVNHSPYDAWGTPRHYLDNRTNNMFSGYVSPSSHFVGPVNDDDPFATTAPANTKTQFGPTAFNQNMYIPR